MSFTHWTFKFSYDNVEKYTVYTSKQSLSEVGGHMITPEWIVKWCIFKRTRSRAQWPSVLAAEKLLPSVLGAAYYAVAK